MNKGIERGLKELEIPYDTFFISLTTGKRMMLFRAVSSLFKGGNLYGRAVGQFSPLISMLCEELGIVYTAWVYDSPLHIRNLESLKNSCNRIFFFDRGQAEEHHKMESMRCICRLRWIRGSFVLMHRNGKRRLSDGYLFSWKTLPDRVCIFYGTVTGLYKGVSGRNRKCTGQSVRWLSDTGINYR